MNVITVGMATGGFAMVAGTVLAYFRTITRNTVPVRVTAVVVQLCSGMALAVAAIVWSYVCDGSLGLLVAAFAVSTVMFGAMLLWLLTQRKIPAGDLQVEVGDRWLSFAAVTSTGAAFHSDALAGKRTLLKFFRGGW